MLKIQSVFHNNAPWHVRSNYVHSNDAMESERLVYTVLIERSKVLGGITILASAKIRLS